MKRYATEIVLALVFLVLFLAFSRWQAPHDPLTPEEVETYVERVRTGAPMNEPVRIEIARRLRIWGAEDDGEPIYMLNVMRYYDSFQLPPGVTVDAATPEDALARYNKVAMQMALKLGMYPMYFGTAHGIELDSGRVSNLVTFRPEVDDWDEALIVRYPSRRAFFELISSPEYWEVMPLKTASVEVVLIPTAAVAVLPDLRFLLGGTLVMVLLAVGWARSARWNSKS